MLAKSYLAIANRLKWAIFLICLSLFTIQPALAHHAMGGKTPTNFLEGWLSGLAHPIIGLDHFAFVVAVGLIAALKNRRGLIIPLAFTFATAFGTIIHLQGLNLPFPEIIIALSVLAMGIALATQQNWHEMALISLSALSGIFHGFAYGEAIFGAEMTPLGAYLLGFVMIQSIISAIAFTIGRLTLKGLNNNTSLSLRFAGCVISGIGLTFLSGAIFS